MTEEQFWAEKLYYISLSIAKSMLLWEIHLLAVQRQVKSPDGRRQAGFPGFGHPQNLGLPDGMAEFDEAEFEKQVKELAALEDGSLACRFYGGKVKKWQRT